MPAFVPVGVIVGAGVVVRADDFVACAVDAAVEDVVDAGVDAGVEAGVDAASLKRYLQACLCV